jgi:Xaa-Pro dipeptidase
MNRKRMEQALRRMADAGISQMLVCDPSSIFYLTGEWFSPGERLLVLLLSCEQGPQLFINELFPVRQDFGIPVTFYADIDDPVGLIARKLDPAKPIGIDKKWPARFLLHLMEGLGRDGRYLNSSFILDHMRMVKDEQEIAFMREAAAINEQAMATLVKLLPAMHSEKQMGQLLLETYEELGSTGFSFAPNISYGANGADPHHKIGGSLVKADDSIVIDIGCRKRDYCSDMTRTFFFQSVTPRAKAVYDIVLTANQRAIDKIRPNVRFSEIDAAARDYITAQGFGSYFTHRTGHCIGLDVHDWGDVSAANQEYVRPGMIFSIEPGIYLPGELGVRIEDLELVTEDGCELLTHYGKELTVIK